jgi:hypothetical protein
MTLASMSRENTILDTNGLGLQSLGLKSEGAVRGVRSDSPFTKRSGDMVYNSWLD